MSEEINKLLQDMYYWDIVSFVSLHDNELTSFMKKILPNYKSCFMNRILVNKIKCKKCGDIIESNHGHDFKFCKCGTVAVDGGKEYLRRLGYEEDYEELSEIEEKTDDNTKKH